MSKRIFIVEDDINTLAGLQAKFSSDGYSVFTSAGTENIHELIIKIKSSEVNCIILDIVLPRFDGFEVIQAIKADDYISKIPVFVFTNLADKDTKHKCEILGAAQVFIKNDYMLDDFVAKIKKIIINREKVKL